MKSKNKKILDSFVKYCNTHPNERFWQALRDWSGFKFIYVSDKSTSTDEKDIDIVNSLYDTFYFTWDDDPDNPDYTMFLAVDGKRITKDKFWKILSQYEGWTFKLKIMARTEE